MTVFEAVEHKFNESVGPTLGSWLGKVVAGDPHLKRGAKWLVVPERGQHRAVGGEAAKIDITASVPSERHVLRPGGVTSPNLAVDQIVRNPGEILVRGYLTSLPPAYRGMVERTMAFWLGL